MTNHYTDYETDPKQRLETPPNVRIGSSADEGMTRDMADTAILMISTSSFGARL